MTCCKTSVRFDINFTFSTEHRLTFTILAIVVGASVVGVVALAVGRIHLADLHLIRCLFLDCLVLLLTQGTGAVDGVLRLPREAP
jgi:hypothetical protein